MPESFEKPLACWRGTDRYGDRILDTLTIIFRTGGCEWNRCRMCSYRHERYYDRPEKELQGLVRQQMQWVKENHSLEEVDMIKIFTSGSFFDPREVDPETREYIGKMLAGKLVVVETRPEYIREPALSGFIRSIDTGEWKTPLYVAVGLETTDDTIREKSINKGFSTEDFWNAADIARKAGVGVKAYLLMKPLFLTEDEALIDMENSIADIYRRVDMISMNPCTVQKNTELERYWKQGAYRPPYLWSVLSVLLSSPVHILCDPVGGGYQRGPHNCRKCDRDILAAIREYSLNADSKILQDAMNIPCECKKEWEFVLGHEMPYSMPLTR
jgi:radical SAM enzyme (TIGR01210 family)